MAIVRIEKPENFVGMDAKQAEIDIAQHGYECRIAEIDGRMTRYGMRPDYDPLRVNLHVKAGLVVKATIG